jgi:hypothetical protein
MMGDWMRILHLIHFDFDGDLILQYHVNHEHE